MNIFAAQLGYGLAGVFDGVGLLVVKIIGKSVPENDQQTNPGWHRRQLAGGMTNYRSRSAL